MKSAQANLIQFMRVKDQVRPRADNRHAVERCKRRDLRIAVAIEGNTFRHVTGVGKIRSMIATYQHPATERVLQQRVHFAVAEGPLDKQYDKPRQRNHEYREHSQLGDVASMLPGRGGATLFRCASRWTTGHGLPLRLRMQMCRAAAWLSLHVGDLHVDSFGTWRDAEGRLCWGVDDFDEAFPLPYTNDLVRLVASVKVSRWLGLLNVKTKDACESVKRETNHRDAGSLGPTLRPRLYCGAQAGLNKNKLRSTLLSSSEHGTETQLDIIICGRPIAHTDTHCCAALPYGASAPTCAILLNSFYGALSLLSTSEGNQDLIQYDLIQYFMPSST